MYMASSWQQQRTETCKADEGILGMLEATLALLAAMYQYYTASRYGDVTSAS